jgi:hypothetical protein
MTEKYFKVSFKFEVMFCGNLENDLNIAPEHTELVINWYMDYGYFDEDMEDPVMELVKGTANQFCYTYLIKKSVYDKLGESNIKINHKMIADPDDDGNYPVEIDDENWLIAGNLIEENYKIEEVVTMKEITSMVDNLNLM